MSVKEFAELSGSQKGALVYRVGVAITLLVGTAIMTGVLGYAKSANEKLSRTASDVAQIKWELPVIKDTAERDKSDVLSRINALENRLENIRNIGENRAAEIASLKTEIAVLKQKLP